MRPGDTDSEKNAIGTALMIPEAMDDLLQLHETDFDNTVMRRCFKVLCALNLEGEVDPLQFQDKAKLKGSELFDLQHRAISSTLMPSYVRKLKDRSKRRALIEASQILLQKSQDYSLDANDIIAEASDKLEGVAVDDAQDPELLINIVERRLENFMGDKADPGIPTGLLDLDRLWSGFYPSELTVLAARPSMGKTSLAQYLAVQVAQHTGEPSLIISLEMAKEYLTDRYISTVLNNNVDDLRRGYVKKSKLENNYNKILTELAKNKIYIQDDSNLTSYEVLAQARKLKRREGLGIIIIDYLTLLSDQKDRGDSEALKVAQLTRRIRAIAKQLKVPVLVLAQLNRGVERREDKRPIMSDLKESGGIEEAADNILFLYRDNYYNPDNNDSTTEIIVAKQKQGPRGVTAYVIYEAETGTWKNKLHGYPTEEEKVVWGGGKQ